MQTVPPRMFGTCHPRTNTQTSNGQLRFASAHASALKEAQQIMQDPTREFSRVFSADMGGFNAEFSENSRAPGFQTHETRRPSYKTHLTCQCSQRCRHKPIEAPPQI